MSAKEDVYLARAPPDAAWSRWAKPILFSFMANEPSPLASSLRADERNLPCDGSSALVIDLPGVESVKFGLQAARCGCQPVPLFNAYPQLPDSQQRSTLDRNAVTYLPVVDMRQVVAALYRGGEAIREFRLSPNAPPAFMIDSLRHGAGISIQVGMFDNRSALDPSDFPSGALLSQHGIQRVVLVQERRKIDDDLNSVLLAWQNAGIEINFLSTRPNSAPEKITIEPPSLLRRLWFRISMAFYAKDGYGAFGRVVSSSG